MVVDDAYLLEADVGNFRLANMASRWDGGAQTPLPGERDKQRHRPALPRDAQVQRRPQQLVLCYVRYQCCHRSCCHL